MEQHEYMFDVKLFATIRVKAATVEEARGKYVRLLDCATANLGMLDGEPLLCEVSLDEPENDELVEVDGEAV